MIDKRHFKNALEAQTAPNLVAVVGSFAEALRAMMRDGLGMQEMKTHPITILFMTQLVHLTQGFEEFAGYARAVVACERGAEL